MVSIMSYLHTLVHNPLFWVAVGALAMILVLALKSFRKSETSDAVVVSLHDDSHWDPEERDLHNFEDRIR